MKAIVLLGGPNSGKGTQARNLVRHLAAAHVSTGDLLRNHMDSDLEARIELGPQLAAGKLVDDTLVTTLVEGAVSQVWHQVNVIVFDGYPRLYSQCGKLQEIVGHETPTLAIYLRLRTSEMLRRSSTRHQCNRCGSSGTSAFRCACGGMLRRRDDDKQAIVRSRIEMFETQIPSILDYYLIRGELREFDGDQSSDVVMGAIMSTLRGWI